MSDSQPPSPSISTHLVTSTELFWLVAGMWLSGACLLALLPVMLMPRLGPAAALAVSYVAFFIAWQPLQRVIQRAIGPQAATIRMLALVGSAAVVAYYVREALLALVRGGGA